MSINANTPMMKQYFEIKNLNKDTLLFFRLGDFYEMFFDDARLASKELNLTLTARDCGQGQKAPMCGVPYSSAEQYISKLVSKGYKVAVCDQVEDPAVAKGIVKRDITRIVTPGTLTDDTILDESKNNYICAFCISHGSIGLCFCDISTGQLLVTEFSENDVSNLMNEIGKFSPKEVLTTNKIFLNQELKEFIKVKLQCRIEILEKEEFSFENSVKSILKQFNKTDLNDFGFKTSALVMSLGALLNYLSVTQKHGISRITDLKYYSTKQFMSLNMNTIRNLELLSSYNKEKKGSLIWVLDKTKTSMGKRLLRSCIEQPLIDIFSIKRRQAAIEEIYSNVMIKDVLAELLFNVNDISRLMTKIMYGSANGRDLRSLGQTLKILPKVKQVLNSAKSDMLLDIKENIDELKDISQLIDDSIVDTPPVSIREGNIIRKGYDKELDTLRDDMNGGKDTIAKIESNEREKTSIPKLKVGYNKIFGYYIEVSNSYKSKVPDYYIRKQTLSNCERYITSELKNLESRVLSAKDKSLLLEYEIFQKIRILVGNEIRRIEKTSDMIATLDVLRSLAEVALSNNYTKPEITDENSIILKESRHPVVENLLKDEPFVPNDALLDTDTNTIAIITGPNMAGKSTYMRQIALITIMAQMGSFVPAAYAKIGIVDSVFTRIGASDDISSGFSTFMVEMNEVTQILEKATQKSLIILDEVGRGTSTFDGMSIAKAVIEYISDKKKLGAKTLFSTHYHELTSMEHTYDNIKNYNIAVKKNSDNIIFLRKIVPGGADDSYGIEVAKLAGLPNSIIVRAREILKDLENKPVNLKEKNVQNFFDMEKSQNDQKINSLIDTIKNLNLDTLSPLECMNNLFKIKNMVSDLRGINE